MAVSKRTRFEVLRRDNHTCRYCRATDGPLTIDHVTPVALGGTDDPSNLVTACRDCNAGKASSSPDSALVADVSEDAVRWAAARAEAAEEFEQRQAVRDRRVRPFIKAWRSWDADQGCLPRDWKITVNGWIDAGVDIKRIVEAHDIAASHRHVKSQDVFAYMCGIVRNWLQELDARTLEIVEEQEEQREWVQTWRRWQMADVGYRLIANVIEGSFGNVREAFDARPWEASA